MRESAASESIEEFARAFPFHLVIEPDLTLSKVGSGLLKIDPGLRAGEKLAEHFAVGEEDAPPCFATFVAAPEEDFCLLHRRTQLELRGRMVVTAADGPLVFLGCSWLDDAEQLADFGVTVDGLPAFNDAQAHLASVAELPSNDPADLLAQVRRLQRRLALSRSISGCLAESRDLEAALAALPESVSRSLEWQSASIWRKDGGEIRRQHRYPAGHEEVADHDLAVETFRTGAPGWTTRGCGGRGGFAIPANADNGTVAVLTCVSGREESEDSLLDDLYLAAGQLSAFLARQNQAHRLTRLTSELSAIFQLSADGFVAFNGDGILSYLNPAFARMTGFERDELRGLDQPAFEARISELLDPVQPPRTAGNGDRIVTLAKPRTLVLQRSMRDARGLDGHLVGRLLYFRDITLETALLKANGEFLANAAHELRTPLASIHGFVELMLKQELPPEKRRQVLETVLGQSRRLIDIINELLEVARFDARGARDLDRKLQPLTQIVRQTVAELLVPNDAREVKLALPPDDQQSLVMVDRDRIGQVILNLLSNAYKYSPAGGEIAIEYAERTRSGHAWVGLAIRDHGVGMSADELRHLFDRFFRARPASAIPGTGLGMSMVKRIIEAHDGHIDVDSAPGAGTTVTFWLPRSQTSS